ncbi:hypothetical protein PGB90_009743 [Kerria lacca]
MHLHVLICGIIILIATNLLSVTAPFSTTHSFEIHNKIHISRHKRSFYDIDCKGTYDKTLFSKLDQVCDDCYILIRESKLHSLCRKECFSTEYFRGCAEMLNVTDGMDKFRGWIQKLRGINA